MKSWLKNGKKLLINGKMILCPECSCDQCKAYGFWVDTNSKVYVGSSLPEGKTGMLYATLQDAINNEDFAKIYVRAATITDTIDCQSKHNWIKAWNGEPVILQKGVINGHNPSRSTQTLFEDVECEISNHWDASFLNSYFHNIHTDMGSVPYPGGFDITVSARCGCVFDDMSTGSNGGGGDFFIDYSYFCTFSNIVFGNGEKDHLYHNGGGFQSTDNYVARPARYIYDCVFENIVFGNGGDADNLAYPGAGGGGGFALGGAGSMAYGSEDDGQGCNDIERCVFRNIVFGNGGASVGGGGGGGGGFGGGGGGAGHFTGGAGGISSAISSCIFENIQFGNGGDGQHAGGGGGFGGGGAGCVFPVIGPDFGAGRGGNCVIWENSFKDIVFGNGGNGVDPDPYRGNAGGGGGFGGGAGACLMKSLGGLLVPSGGYSYFCRPLSEPTLASIFDNIVFGKGGISNNLEAYAGFAGGYGGDGFNGGNVKHVTFLQPGTGLVSEGGSDGAWSACI